ncbi:hypothetical protein F4779DRAFT_331607 [Xylariaceae sp. FL0662B]|nr:hypothetical protein F4779DRAFT_331607 [Xylariaceae sp. FL0662B]
MADTSDYTKLSVEDRYCPEIDQEVSGSVLTTKLGRRAYRRSILVKYASCILLSVTAIIFAAMLLYTAVTLRHISTRIAADFGDCGSQHTAAEARALGCVFDPAAWVWTRPECYDAELVAEFMNRTTMSYHTDPELRQETEVPLEDVMRGDHKLLFTQNKYHYLHCTYMMKKMHKALLEHRPTDSYMRTWQHTNHCEMVLLNSMLHEDEGLECEAGDICPTWLGKATWTSCARY